MLGSREKSKGGRARGGNGKGNGGLLAPKEFIIGLEMLFEAEVGGVAPLLLEMGDSP